jgi:hypothetical protein
MEHELVEEQQPVRELGVVVHVQVLAYVQVVVLISLLEQIW